jgi:hypothetical protein
MNNFCIAPCLFSVTKLWEIAIRTWSIYLVDEKPNMFLCSPQCRNRTFLGGSRWRACFCAYPQCRSSRYMWVVCTWSWF